MSDSIFSAQRHIELVNSALEKVVGGAEIPTLLQESMYYSLFPGGKRLRPCICFATAQMLGGSIDDALPFACALEMIHTYSLVHDDLPCMDNDDYRRGRLSNHKKFGEANAVLAGDGLLSLAFESMLKAGMNTRAEKSRYLAAMYEVARGAGTSGMVAGQSLDLMFEGNTKAGIAELQSIHKAKTGALIKAAVLSGAVIAGADDEDIAAVSLFAEKYGILFQLTDDILDVTGDAEKMGKTLGKDKEEHKLTYPLICGLDESRQIAARIASEAKDALSRFGEHALYLNTLTDTTIERDR